MSGPNDDVRGTVCQLSETNCTCQPKPLPQQEVPKAGTKEAVEFVYGKRVQPGPPREPLCPATPVRSLSEEEIKETFVPPQETEEEFAARLKRARAIVRSWPKWKQEVLSAPVVLD